jgi:hypothetical protein
MRVIENKLQMPRYAYIAPYRAQAKSIAWNYMKQYTVPLAEYRKINESELKIELPSNYPHLPGAVLCIHGADNPDSIRGMYWDGVILDEYAQMKHELWELETCSSVTATTEPFDTSEAYRPPREQTTGHPCFRTPFVPVWRVR